MADVTLLSSEQPLDLAADLLSEALEQVGPGARLGVPGGSALDVLTRVRAELAPELWRALKLTWVDERVVPLDDPHSNRGEAYRKGALAKAAPVALELPLVLDGESADAAVARSARAFTDDFRGALDVALLGMGEDGHVASLFPGHPLLAHPGPVAALHDAPKPPPTRVTLSLPVLARPGLRRFIVATGKTKRDAVMRLLAGDADLPASRLGPVTVITD